MCRAPNTRMQRTRSSPSALRSPLMRCPLGPPTLVLSVWALLASILISRSVVAQPIPPPSVPDSFAAEDRLLKARPVTRLTLGKFVARFEETTLGEVREAIGSGSIAHQGDAGESTYWLCYTVSSPQAAQRLWITSGEMGGTRHTIGGVVAQELPAGTVPNAGCPVLSSTRTPLSLDGGVWIGGDLSLIEKVLGKPSASHGGWLEWSYQGKIQGRDIVGASPAAGSLEFDELSLLQVRVTDGRVVALSASKVTSN